MTLRTCDSSVIHIAAICGTGVPTFDASKIAARSRVAKCSAFFSFSTISWRAQPEVPKVIAMVFEKVMFVEVRTQEETRDCLWVTIQPTPQPELES